MAGGLGLLAIGAAVVLSPIGRGLRTYNCIASGGQWMSAHDCCETEDCVDAHECLPSYNNTAICRTLSLGVARRTIIFRLGEPIKVEGRVVYFTPSPTGWPIRAELDASDRVQRLDCNGSPPTRNIPNGTSGR